MNESCWICLACMPACRLAEAGFTTTLHWHRAESRPVCTTTAAAIHTLGTGSYSSDATNEEKTRDRARRAFSIFKGGTQQLRRGLTLQFRHQLLPQPNPPSTLSHPYQHHHHSSFLLLPMPLSSAAPLTSLASIWIEAPCFSSYKSR